jgi:PAS domain S-box-containing protein
MKSKRIFWMTTGITAGLFLASIGYRTASHQVLQQQKVDQQAAIISPSLWSFNSDLATDYLQLACEVNHYQKLVVSYSFDQEFIALDAPLVNPIDRFFSSVSLIRTVPLHAEVLHNGAVIGEIAVEWVDRAIYGYLVELLILVLLLTIFGFFLSTLKEKGELEDRVKERTADLEKEMQDRKAAVETLRQSEERMRLFFERQITGLAITSPEKGWLQVNDPLCEMLGYTREELDHLTWSELTHPDDLAADEIQFNQMLNGEIDGYMLDKRFLRKDGKIVSASLSVGCVRHPDGSVDYVLASLLNITDRKQAEEELRESDARYRRAQAVAHVGSWEYDLQTALFSASDEAKLIYGLDLKDEGFSTDEIEQCIPERERVHQALTDLIATDKPYNLEFEIHPKNGLESKFIASIAELKRDEHGVAQKVVGIIQDITERKQTMEKIRAGEKRFRALFEQAGDYCMVLDPNTADGIPVIVDANEAACAMHGYSREEFIGRPVAMDDAEGRQNVMEHTRQIMTGKPFFSENTRVRKDGSTFCVSVHANRIDIEGEPPLIFTTEYDITERKRIEQELQKSHESLERRVEERTLELKARKDEAETLNRAMINLLQDLKETNLGLETAQEALHATNNELEAFSYSVSHDLRAPLRHIDGFVQLLLKREKGHLDETSARYLDTIAQSSGRMGQLIDDLLAFARTGRAELHQKPVASNELILEIMDEFSSQAKDRHLTWEIDDLPAVLADRNLLRQVWQNLIGNALKYTAPCTESHIEIGASHSPDKKESSEIIFFVRDNGVGFDPQYKHKLFGVFQRLHRTDEFEGTGIGLATVRRIVHRHGGRVWAEGKIGEGATFYFTLKQAKGTE